MEDKKGQVGSVVFSAEMLNQPVDRETAVLKRESFSYKPHEDLEPRPTRNFISVDTEGTVAKFCGIDDIGVTLTFMDADSHSPHGGCPDAPPQKSTMVDRTTCRCPIATQTCPWLGTASAETSLPPNIRLGPVVPAIPQWSG